ncbi:phosphoribosyltransferase family protein [Arthrobacter sp. Br18]|uniref:ComF family protein n=1 Tax=Arthrobacter sp. Br18 TaxID=1312954 RepID=UPI0004ADEA74|nr:phosphoribosyltransferase family protein [Arthrobacter sp. Br18]
MSVKAVLVDAMDRVVLAPSWRVFAGAVGSFWSLILPTACVRCGAWDRSLCLACLEDFRRATVHPFRAEGDAGSLPEIVPPPGVGLRSSALPTNGPGEFVPLPVTAAGVYAGSVASAVLAFKNHGHTDLERPLAAALAGALHVACAAEAEAGITCNYLLVPVPGRPGSIRRRGYDPVGLVLQFLSKRGELPAGTGVFAGVRPRTAWLGMAAGPPSQELWRRVAASFGIMGSRGGQKGLGRRGRQRRVAGSMAVPSRTVARVQGRACLVIDDVLTTGSTVAEVTRALREAGAYVVGAVVIAATSPPSATKSVPPHQGKKRRGEG